MPIRSFLLTALLFGLVPTAAAQPTIEIASKKFTESVILAEAATALVRQAGLEAEHQQELGGTRFLWEGLVEGDLDVYPEYTGTITQEILAGEDLPDLAAIRAALAQHGVGMTEPLGLNNTYALGMNEALAERLGIRRTSDLRKHPELRFAFSNEFMDRGDGWPSLQRSYRLPQADVRGIDHDLAYRGLESGSIDVIDLYTTDAEIDYYGLRVLEDDLGHFAEYNAVFLYRADLAERAPGAVEAIRQLEGAISSEQMIQLNARAKIDKVSEARVAADFLDERLDLAAPVEVRETTWWDDLFRWTGQHLYLVGISLLAAILVAIPLGVAAAKLPGIGQVILGTVGVIYTIPSLALLVFMIPLLGIGGPPAMVALFLYSLLPIVRNTHAGLTDIPPAVRESAEALGLTSMQRLRLVELPLAARAILAGIKTSAVINIGTATLGALIGAGGYGQPILTGIRLDDVGLILSGAIPAALLALVAQGLFEIAERLVVPKGLRLGG